ncbi:hypothetical protein SSP531S_57300 [Streptomyces spongiicola]|uniref:DUF6777 domain-containing protein n=1 Tax=Streptomyces spongiicola TaxID=1690221 RepID=A0A388T5K9_9ACTN|nr:hypothetical protein SSP531S_57300 [Streptomyces spongiicola]
MRCARGSPLAPAVAVQGEQRYQGEQRASFRSSTIVAVAPASKPMKAVTRFDPEGVERGLHGSRHTAAGLGRPFTRASGTRRRPETSLPARRAPAERHSRRLTPAGGGYARRISATTPTPGEDAVMRWLGRDVFVGLP